MAKTFPKYQKYRQKCVPDQGPQMILALNPKGWWWYKDSMNFGQNLLSDNPVELFCLIDVTMILLDDYHLSVRMELSPVHLFTI